MQGVDNIFYIVVLIMSVVIHEVAHGYAADMEGDPTARYAGRLTLNPLKHIDLLGSIILPIFLVVTHSSFLVGWAKPVPYMEANLRDKRKGTVIVASAGIIANFILALFFGLLAYLLPIAQSVKQSICNYILYGGQVDILGILPRVFFILAVIVLVNLVLAFFNLIPIPPLDGSKIFFNIVSRKYFSHKKQEQFEKYSLPILFIFIIFIWPYIAPLIGYVFTLLTGSGLM